MSSSAKRPGDAAANRAPRCAPAFSLTEMIVVIGIIALLAGVATVSWKAATAQSVRSLAINTLTGYIGVARGYAMANRIETMLVINPFDGRLELWRANPPMGQVRNPPWPQNANDEANHPDNLNRNITPSRPPAFPNGGPWDIQSGTAAAPSDGAGADAAQRARANGYAFVPFFDNSARLPVDSNGAPRVFVCPLDFANRADATNNYRFLPPGEITQNQPPSGRALIDNLVWTCLCFGPDGRLIVRARRVDLNSRGDPNARGEYQPRTLLAEPGDVYSVDTTQRAETNNPHRFDTLLLSTLGVVISESQAFAAFSSPASGGMPLRQLLTTATPAVASAHLTNWLYATQPGVAPPPGVSSAVGFATHMLLDQWTGRPVQIAGEAK